MNSTVSRPRSAPAEVRKQQLIDATITCISRVGISGTTLTMVTREAGLSLGLVNFHFKSKDMLLAQTLRHLASEHRELWIRKLDCATIPASDKLRSIVDAQFHPRICNRRKLAVWFAFFGEARYRKSYRSISSDIDMERQDVCVGLCQEIIAEGAYRDVSAEGVALTLEGMFDGLWLNILMYPAKFTRGTAKRQVLNYLAHSFPCHFPGTYAQPGAEVP